MHEISRYLSEIERRCGLKGGTARMNIRMPEQRKALAKKAAQESWSKARKEPEK